MTETLAHRYSSENTQRELSNEYQHDRVRGFSKIFVSLCLVQQEWIGSAPIPWQASKSGSGRALWLCRPQSCHSLRVCRSAPFPTKTAPLSALWLCRPQSCHSLRVCRSAPFPTKTAPLSALWLCRPQSCHSLRVCRSAPFPTKTTLPSVTHTCSPSH